MVADDAIRLMDPWVTTLLIWLAIGAVTMAVIGIAVSRSSDLKGMFPDSTPAETLILCMLLVAGGPLILLYALGGAVGRLWVGKLPFTGRIWWPARATKCEGPPTLETTLCQMIGLRRRLNGRIQHRGSPSHWPMAKLWKAPEAIIAKTSERYLLLRDDGLSHSEVIARLEEYRLGADVIVTRSLPDLKTYLMHILETEDPVYLALDHETIDRSVHVAMQHALLRIQAAKGALPYPPKEWLLTRIDPGSSTSQPAPIGAPAYLSFLEEPGLGELKLRVLDGDELWTFSSPPETWRKLCGRSGAALVRNGRAVAHVITAMN